MYLFIDQDGSVTKGEGIGNASADSWPSVIKIEIDGDGISVKQLRLDDEWIDVPSDD